MTELGEYLRRAGSRPFKAGSHDCCTLPCDWAAMRCGSDPMVRWRGHYDTEEGAYALIEKAGGLIELWELGMLDALIPAVDEARAGDIGIVSVSGEDFGAIFTGERWALLIERGLFFIRADPLKVWRP